MPKSAAKVNPLYNLCQAKILKKFADENGRYDASYAIILSIQKMRIVKSR